MAALQTPHCWSLLVDAYFEFYTYHHVYCYSQLLTIMLRCIGHNYALHIPDAPWCIGHNYATTYPRCSMVLEYWPTLTPKITQMSVNIPAPWSIWVSSSCHQLEGPGNGWILVQKVSRRTCDHSTATWNASDSRCLSKEYWVELENPAAIFFLPHVRKWCASASNCLIASQVTAKQKWFGQILMLWQNIINLCQFLSGSSRC